MPASRFGTVHAGMLMVRGLFTLIVANGLGLWVKAWSAFFAPPHKFDYMSAYLYLAFLGALGCAVAAFATRGNRLSTPPPANPTCPSEKTALPAPRLPSRPCVSSCP
jgi:hypothetical protein